jgi:hypothetical protein
MTASVCAKQIEIYKLPVSPVILCALSGKAFDPLVGRLGSGRNTYRSLFPTHYTRGRQSVNP